MRHYTACGWRPDKSFNPEPAARLAAKSTIAVADGSGLNDSIAAPNPGAPILFESVPATRLAGGNSNPRSKLQTPKSRLLSARSLDAARPRRSPAGLR